MSMEPYSNCSGEMTWSRTRSHPNWVVRERAYRAAPVERSEKSTGRTILDRVCTMRLLYFRIIGFGSLENRGAGLLAAVELQQRVGHIVVGVLLIAPIGVVPLQRGQHRR